MQETLVEEEEIVKVVVKILEEKRVVGVEGVAEIVKEVCGHAVGEMAVRLAKLEQDNAELRKSAEKQMAMVAKLAGVVGSMRATMADGIFDDCEVLYGPQCDFGSECSEEEKQELEFEDLETERGCWKMTKEVGERRGDATMVAVAEAELRRVRKEAAIENRKVKGRRKRAERSSERNERCVSEAGACSSKVAD